MSERFMLNGAILMFAEGLNVAKSGSKSGEGEKKYRIKLVVPPNHPQLPALEALQLKIANEKWPNKGAAALKAIKANPNHCLLKDGDLKTDWEGFEGMLYISAASKTKPSIIVTRDGVNTPVTFDEGVVYSGCKVNASIEVYAYDNDGKGMTAGIRGVQFAGAGKRFGGGGSAASEDEFGAMAVEDADDLA